MPAMKKKRGQAFLEDLPTEELQRRKKQRELQQQALALRKQGQEYVKSSNPREGVEEHPRSQSSKANKAHGHVQAPFQVAIIAIFWNQRPLEKKLVVAKCEEAEIFLQKANISSSIDSKSKFTPGQRMRHWEEKGVKVRVEVGPKDAEQNACIVARCQATPGQVAHKRTSEIGSEMCRTVKELLQMPDEEVPEGDVERYQAAKVYVAKSTSSKPKSSKLPASKAKVGKFLGVGGGDDLEDDFAGI